MTDNQSGLMGLSGEQGVASSIMASCGRLGLETRYDVACVAPDGSTRWRDTCLNRVVAAGLNKVLDATFKTGLATPAWYVGIVGPSVTVATVSSGSSLVGSTTAPWQVGVDDTPTGRAIILKGAAGGGADLVTTITSVISSSQISVNTSPSTSLTNVSAVWEARSTETMAAHGSWNEVTAYSNANRPTFTPGAIAAGSVDNSGAVAAFTINANNTVVGGLFLSDSSAIGGATGTLYGMAPFSGAGFRTVNNGDTLNVTATLTAASA